MICEQNAWPVGIVGDYFNWRRIVRPSLLFLSSVTIVSIVSYRLGMTPVHSYEPWFYSGAALSSMIGYKAASRLRRSMAMIVSGAATLLCGVTYVGLLSHFVGETGLKTSLLFALFILTFSFLYVSLAILRNRGYR